MYICSLPTVLSEDFSSFASSFLQTTPGPTVVFSPSPFPACTVHHIHVRFQLESQLSYSNTFQRYQQFSKRTLLNANNPQRIVLQVTVSQSNLHRGGEEKEIIKNPQLSGLSPECPLSPSLFLVFLPFPSSFIPAHGLRKTEVKKSLCSFNSYNHIFSDVSRIRFCTLLLIACIYCQKCVTLWLRFILFIIFR